MAMDDILQPMASDHLSRLCQLVSTVGESPLFGDGQEMAHDCFCGANPIENPQVDPRILTFMENVVEMALHQYRTQQEYENAIQG